MFLQSLNFINCPSCFKGNLKIEAQDSEILQLGHEIKKGVVTCEVCNSRFPIIKGVLFLVENIENYFNNHEEGLKRIVNQDFECIPKGFKIKESTSKNTSEWNLESEKVTSWYVFNHFIGNSLTTRFFDNERIVKHDNFNALLKVLNQNNLFELLENSLKKDSPKTTLDIGCNVGKSSFISSHFSQNTLGVDINCYPIYVARTILLKNGDVESINMPFDLNSKKIDLKSIIRKDLKGSGFVDFIVCNINEGSIKKQTWDSIISFNVLDMMNSPQKLIQKKKHLLKDNGNLIQACPYIWFDETRNKLKKENQTSVDYVRSLLIKNNFKILHELDFIPWQFIKNQRQLEFYFLHYLKSKKIK